MLLAVLSVLCLPPAVRAQKDESDDTRVRRARQELQTSKDVLATLTNETDIAQWRKRVDLAAKELENARRLVDLERKEKTFTARRRIRLDYELRDALRGAESVTPEDERVFRTRRDEIKRLIEHRAHLVGMQQEKAESEEDLAARAEREARIRNVDAKILALALGNDAAELRLRMAREVERIEAALKALDPNPRATVRLLVTKRQNLSSVRNTLQEFRLQARDLKARIEETDNALAIARERSEGVDETINILQERYRVERPGSLSGTAQERRDRAQRLKQMLDETRSGQNLLAERIEHLEAQQQALAQSRTLADQGAALLGAESAFLHDDLRSLAGRYMRQTLAPLGMVVLLILLYSVISRYLFPRFLTAEALFVARRLGGYAVVMLIVLLLCGFFLEDLKAIATVMGIVGAAVVIALQDLCSAFAGWFVIVACRKIKLGDRVEIDGRRGDVIDIQMLRITLLEVNNWLGVDDPTGRVLLIPNSFIFKSHVFNYSHVHPYVAGKLELTVTYETPLREAGELLERVLREETVQEFREAAEGEGRLKTRYGLSHAGYSPKIHVTLADSGVCFALFFVSHYRGVSGVRDRIAKRVMTEFEKDPRFALAYPTQRHLVSQQGGGPADGAAAIR
jgi:small-conductance mechanosensitive channel